MLKGNTKSFIVFPNLVIQPTKKLPCVPLARVHVGKLSMGIPLQWVAAFSSFTMMDAQVQLFS